MTMTTKMSEAMAQDLLAEIIDSSPTAESVVTRIATFAEAGVMSDNAGLVIRLADGSEFQVQIVRSR
jgi:hypothetical protein